MTLIVSWLGVDSRGPSSLYLMSDSRISWVNGLKTDVWDYGKKVFAFKNSSDIIGYCGDAFFTTQIISHIVNLADMGVLFSNGFDSAKKFELIKYKVKELLESFPELYMQDSFTILYGARNSIKSFSCYELTWNKSGSWTDSSRTYSDFSDRLMAFGTGAEEFEANYIKYQKSDIKRTSRAIFQCFCDSLENIKDKHCGGAPQLVGLYRIKNGIDYGIVYKNKRYISGVSVENLGNFEGLEWRNELFERFDGNSKKIKLKAQKQPNPLKSKI